MKGISRKFTPNDNIDTDLIIPARYLNTFDPKELALHCMEDADVNFMKRKKDGDFIVAGENFGCGSSREHAPIAIKAANISAVIAKSFARIFFRNSINVGFPIIEIKETDEISDGDQLDVDIEKGEIKNLTTGKTYKAQPFPPFMKNIIDRGGLIEYTKSKI